jgi:ABC-type glycerol-3-phosphate transport system substrate-binding protein
MILLPQDLILKQLDKYYLIPYTTYSARTFKDSFVPEGELYLRPEGIVGLPFSVDPLVMYWNRSMFSNAGVALPPTSWGDFFTLAPRLTTKDQNGNIVQSAIAFGEARNVLHFKDILALLSIQAGTSIVGMDDQGNLASVFEEKGTSVAPAEEALSFFTEFSNPTKTSYSWNRSLPMDRSAFIAGKLALYFGYASELSGIRQANPNLDFDVAMVPQTGNNRATFGAMNAIAILKASRNSGAAYTAAATLTSAALQKEWVTETGYPPVRRDLLTSLPGDAYQAVFWRSALISTAWLDPDRVATVGTFTRLVENATSGKLRVSESVRTASQEIDSLLRSLSI